jgi:3D (Asp-Asp-Asp) domain-containing protein
MTNKLYNTILLLALFILTSYSINLNKEKDIINNKLNQLKLNQTNQAEILDTFAQKIEDNEDLIESIFDIQFHSNVVATMYHPVPEQTDSTPNVTADGTVIEIDNASDYRYIAVSRDLHRRYGGDFNFDDIVYIRSDELTGFFIVKDLMNARFTNRIDFLHSPDTPPFKLVNVELYATNIRQTD